FRPLPRRLLGLGSSHLVLHLLHFSGPILVLARLSGSLWRALAPRRQRPHDQHRNQRAPHSHASSSHGVPPSSPNARPRRLPKLTAHSEPSHARNRPTHPSDSGVPNDQRR